MQLTIKGDDLNGAGTTIRLDSALEGFSAVARRVAATAAANGLALSKATRANFGALGIDCDAPAAAGSPNLEAGMAGTRRLS